MDLLAGSSETVICSSLGLQVIVIHSSTTSFTKANNLKLGLHHQTILVLSW